MLLALLLLLLLRRHPLQRPSLEQPLLHLHSLCKKLLQQEEGGKLRVRVTSRRRASSSSSSNCFNKICSRICSKSLRQPLGGSWVKRRCLDSASPTCTFRGVWLLRCTGCRR